MDTVFSGNSKQKTGKKRKSSVHEHHSKKMKLVEGVGKKKAPVERGVDNGVSTSKTKKKKMKYLEENQYETTRDNGDVATLEIKSENKTKKNKKKQKTREVESSHSETVENSPKKHKKQQLANSSSEKNKKKKKSEALVKENEAEFFIVSKSGETKTVLTPLKGEYKKLKNKDENESVSIIESSEDKISAEPSEDKISTESSEDKISTESFEDKISAKSSNTLILFGNAATAHSNKTELHVDPVLISEMTFKWIVDPLTPAEFSEKYWEKNALWLKRKQKNYYKGLFSSEEFDTILRENSLYFGKNVDVTSYEDAIKMFHNDDGRAMPETVWDYYRNKCSIRIINPQTYCHALHSLICSLQEYFGTMVGCNVYLTPPDSQGYGPHYDDIDGFILQVEGTKKWKLYRPHHDDVLTRYSSEELEYDEIGTPFLTLELKPGDLLYLPRGVIHEASTSEDHSLHITVSTYQTTAYADLLEEMIPKALTAAIRADVSFRRGLPINYLKAVGLTNKNNDSDVKQQVVNTVHELVSRLYKYIDIDEAADRLGRKFMYESMPILPTKEERRCSVIDGGEHLRNGELYDKCKMDLDVSVRLLRYHALRMIRGDTNDVLLFYCVDNAKTYKGEKEFHMGMDEKFVKVVEALQKSYPTFKKISDYRFKLSDQEILDFMVDLWEKRIIVTQSPLPIMFDETDESEHTEE